MLPSNFLIKKIIEKSETSLMKINLDNRKFIIVIFCIYNLILI